MSAIEAPSPTRPKPRVKVTALALEATLRLAAEPNVGKVFWAMQTSHCSLGNNWQELLKVLSRQRRKSDVFRAIVLGGLDQKPDAMHLFICVYPAEVVAAFPRVRKLYWFTDQNEYSLGREVLAEGIKTLMGVASGATNNQQSFVQSLPVVPGLERLLLISQHGWSVEFSRLAAVLADMKYSVNRCALSTKGSANFNAEMRAFLALFGTVGSENRYMRLPLRHYSEL